MKIHITRRGIQIVLGLLWLLDGILQLQRLMFTGSFARQVIAANEQGQPAFIHNPIHLAVHIILMHSGIWTVCFAAIQLTLGVLILFRRTSYYGLLASAVWGIAVWYIGEGLGGLFNGSASLLMGAPGAALLYSIIGLGVLPTKRTSNHRPAVWLVIVWSILWLGGACLQLMNGHNSTGAVAEMIHANAYGAPGWLASLDNSVSRFLINLGGVAYIGLISLEAFIGISALLTRFWRILSVTLGCLLMVAFWFVGQSLGGYYTGLATDPNTAPLVILLGITIIGAKGIDLGLT